MDSKLCCLYKDLLQLTACKPRVENLPGSSYKILTRLNIKRSYKNIEDNNNKN